MFTGGNIPYGYKVVNKKVVVDYDEATVVNEIFTMYANVYMAKDIISHLDEKGITHNGRKFLPNAIYVILHNTKYIGKYEIHGKLYTNIYPPIVSFDVFEQVQRKIEHNRKGQ